jgi:hypothetical protein
MSGTRATLVAFLGVSLAACAGAQQAPSSHGQTTTPTLTAAATTPTPGPTTRPRPTSRPTSRPTPGSNPTPRPTPVPQPVTLTVGDHAQVVTDNLRRRSRPRVRSDAAILGPLLQRGAGLWILGGPVAASGYQWYRVALSDPTGVESSPDRGIGWVASADRDGTPWIAAQPFAGTVPAGSLVWSSPGDGSTATSATFELRAGAPHIGFSGVEGCVYRVRFGANLEFDLGFQGAQLSTVQWPSGPEPSMATSGQGTSLTAMPELPAGTYRLEVSNRGAPMLPPTEVDYPCPWGLAITP